MVASRSSSEQCASQARPSEDTSIGIRYPMVARCCDNMLERCVDSRTIMKPASGVARSLGQESARKWAFIAGAATRSIQSLPT